MTVWLDSLFWLCLISWVLLVDMVHLYTQFVFGSASTLIYWMCLRIIGPSIELSIMSAMRY